MKVRMFVGLSALALVVAALAFSAKTFRATAQEKPLTPTPPTRVSQVPPVEDFRLAPEGPPPPPQLPQNTVPQLVARLKELRNMEKLVTTEIKEKIKAERKSLDDAENELKSLGIEPSDSEPPKAMPAPVNMPTPVTSRDY